MQQFRRRVLTGCAHGKKQREKVFIGRMSVPVVRCRIHICKPGDISPVQAFIDPGVKGLRPVGWGCSFRANISKVMRCASRSSQQDAFAG